MPSRTPIVARRFVPALLLALHARGLWRAAASAPTAAPVPTRSLPLPPAPLRVDLSGIKTYLVGKAGELKAASADKLKAISDRYYDMAKAANFD